MLAYPLWKKLIVLMISLWGLSMTLGASLPESWLPYRLNYLPGQRISLGLDLKGGAYLLLQLDSKAVIDAHLLTLQEQLKRSFRDKKIRSHSYQVTEDSLSLKLASAADLPAAQNLITGLDNLLSLEVGEDNTKLTASFTKEKRVKLLDQAMDQSIEVVRRRVDEFGTTEPLIQRQGENRILIQAPGVKDTAALKKLLNTTAKLTFHLVQSSEPYSAEGAERVRPGALVLPSELKRTDGSPSELLVMEAIPVVGGESLEKAQSAFQDGRAVVNFSFDGPGGRLFGEATQAHIGQRLAIVLDNKVISAPNIQSAILGGNGVITGNFTLQSANELAILLRAGALPAPLTYVEERTVGPGLGQDSIDAGGLAAAVAMVLVGAYMIANYRRFGVYSMLAMVVNLALIIAFIIVFRISLTMPGIAGLILTIGMSVDANVLILERIREEQMAGRKPAVAIDEGYSRAFATILDSHITTLISAILLFALGTGPIKGFAVTLSIGIISSLFTAIMITRYFTISWLQRTRPKRLML